MAKFRPRRLRALVVLASACVAAELIAARSALASCDLIPSARSAFRSSLGTLNRAFASPGDWVGLTLDPLCHGRSPGLPATAADTVVTLVFESRAGAASVLALARSCAALEESRAACATRPTVAAAVCRELSAATDDLDVTSPRELFFRFPDTDDLLLGTNDGLPLTGPVAIAVTAAGDGLPCALATSGRCSGVSNLRACIDDFLADDGVQCGTTPHATFASFTALPPPNDYRATCERPAPPCTGLSDEIRIAADDGGNLLVPMDWTGVLVDSSEVPVARRLRGTTPVEAFAGTREPLRLPGRSFVGSFTTSGERLAALFDPISAPGAGLTLSGATDAPRTVLRVARRSPTRRQCQGGPSDGLACIAEADCAPGECAAARCVGGQAAGEACGSDADCPGSECGSALFEFRDRLSDGGRGPLVLRLASCLGGSNALAPCTNDADCAGGQCTDFELIAEDPIPLDGLVQGEQINAFVTPEAILGSDLNGDGDALDEVVAITDRATGTVLPIGTSGVGRAVTRIRQPPFSYPAIALEGSVIAFLEPETSQGDLDQNGDGDIADTLLRVYRLDGTEVAPAPANPARRLPLAIDAAPLIGGRSIAVSAGHVFFRSRESDVARQRTVLASASSSGTSEPSGIGSLSTKISADGRFVVFRSITRLVPADTDTLTDVYVRDLRDDVTELVSVSSAGDKANAGTTGTQLAISDDGRFVAFASASTNLVPDDTNGVGDVFVRDRLLGTTERASVSSTGAQGSAISYDPFLSGDGTVVAFTSLASNLIENDFNNQPDGFVRDRVAGTTERIAVATEAGPLSGDGRFTVVGRFRSFSLVDRASGTSTLLALAKDGGQGDSQNSTFLSLSADGAKVSVISDATNLVGGDTNGRSDAFVHDITRGRTTRVNVSTAGAQTREVNLTSSIRAWLSSDARATSFLSSSENLVARDQNGQQDAFVHDLVTGITTRVSLTAGGEENVGPSFFPSTSRGGRWTVFETRTALVPEDGNSVLDAYVRGPDHTDTGASDLFPDGELDDTVLEVVDATSGALTTLCPAEDVAIAAGRAAFLRPESAAGSALCPAGSLNGDPDVDDLTVQLWSGAGSPVSLGRAATAIALSDTVLAALVPEASEGSTDLSGDGDATDTVLQVYDLATGSWNDVNLPAESIDVAGDLVAFLSPEDEAGVDLNGDGDLDDRVLRLLVGPPSSPRLVEPALAAEELVLGGHPGSEIVAFRTAEAAQGIDLNGDTDLLDDVLHVYDVATDQVLNTGQAVTPCRLEACDPRVPYKVGRDTVTFLTFEPNQGMDLNGDGDADNPDDLVLQVFNVRIAAAASFSAIAAARSLHDLDSPPATVSLLPIASIKSGICTGTGEACGSDRECPTGTCLLPPGGCTFSLGIPCGPSSGTCGPDSFCAAPPGGSGNGVCKAVAGSCASDKDCSGGATCSPLGQRFQQLPAPFTGTRLGDEILSTGGRCVETRVTACVQSDDCGPAETCGPSGTCEREHGVCRSDDDCPPAATCRRDLVVAGATDSDGDEIPDAFDNCPDVANILQADLDADGVGDACDRATCGNARREDGEDCDDGNASSDDACAPDCRATPLCSGGPSVAAARLTLRGLGSGPGGQSFNLGGRLELGPGQPAGWNPLDLTARGAQIRIEDLGANGKLLFDLSSAGAPVPGGARAPVCDSQRRDGWTGNAGRTTYVYTNASGRLPGAGCAAGSANGLEKLRFDDTRAGRGSVRVTARARGATLPAAVGPLRVTVALSADGSATAAGACAEYTFPAERCRRTASGSKLTCK